MNKIGLDETIEFFISLLKKGASAIIITRDIDTALQFADRIAVFSTILQMKNKNDIITARIEYKPYFMLISLTINIKGGIICLKNYI